MKYVSTRGGVAPTSLDDAILAGLAPDGGLFVPTDIPRVDVAALRAAVDAADAADRPHDAIAAAARVVIAPFFAGSSLAMSLDDIVREAFTFDAPYRATRVPSSLDVLELFHGPTAAFKDFGARFLAATMRRLRAAATDPLTVLVATSGDTGSAVGAAFHRMPGVRVVILYPDGRVSPRQAHQLGCFGDNVAALRVAGSFDDCQRMVKAAFADAALRAAHPLASANSISLGRLLPQMSYYAATAARSWRVHDTAPDFVVPTGNLGNAFAAVLARSAGVPIGDIVLATNANRVLPDFLAGAAYRAQPSRATLANAMDVGDPSNIERLRWRHPDDADLRRAVQADGVDDATLAQAIADGEARYGETWCPHTACAVVVAERLAARDVVPRRRTVVATAHPAKFDTIVEPRVGHAVPLPPALAGMLSRPSHATPIAARDDALRDYLAAR